jgi:YbbR domain-containing protein
MKNIALKAFSLLLAVVLAYAVNSESNSSVVSLVVPIELKNLPSDRVIVRPTKRSVQVTIKGPSFMIGPVASSPPAIRVKLPDQVEARHSVSFNASDVVLPPGVDVLGFEPAEMEFVLESLERREVKVEVPRLGQLAKQFTLEGIEVSPKMLVITGPHSEVRQVRSVETEPVDLREIGKSSTVELRVRIPGSQTIGSTDRVTAHIEVAAVPAERVLKGRPVELRSSPDLLGLHLFPTDVVVTIAGTPQAIEALDPTTVLPFVRLRGGSEVSARQVKVDVELPAGIRLVRVEPPEVTVSAEGIRKESLPSTATIKGKKAVKR